MRKLFQLRKKNLIVHAFALLVHKKALRKGVRNHTLSVKRNLIRLISCRIAKDFVQKTTTTSLLVPLLRHASCNHRPSHKFNLSFCNLKLPDVCYVEFNGLGLFIFIGSNFPHIQLSFYLDCCEIISRKIISIACFYYSCGTTTFILSHVYRVCTSI